MKVLTRCATCIQESAGAFRSTGEQVPIVSLVGEMHDTGVVFASCPKGHKTATLHPRRKHEILFESGASALQDGYAGEAVSTMSAALERCYEFFIRVACRKLGLNVSDVDRSWKLIATQSERQLGAFVFLYQILVSETYELPSWIPKFRNKVIHRGYMPSIDEARKYGEQLFTLMRLIMRKLNEVCSEALSREMDWIQQQQRSAVPSGMDYMFTVTASFDMASDQTFEAWLDDLAKMRS